MSFLSAFKIVTGLIVTTKKILNISQVQIMEDILKYYFWEHWSENSIYYFFFISNGIDFFESWDVFVCNLLSYLPTSKSISKNVRNEQTDS